MHAVCLLWHMYNMNMNMNMIMNMTCCTCGVVRRGVGCGAAWGLSNHT